MKGRTVYYVSIVVVTGFMAWQFTSSIELRYSTETKSGLTIATFKYNKILLGNKVKIKWRTKGRSQLQY